MNKYEVKVMGLSLNSLLLQSKEIKKQEFNISDLVEEMTKKHQCHTIILYGSRARNDFNENSDLDLACFKESGSAYSDCRVKDNIFLDAWIYPENTIYELFEFLKLLNGKVLIQKNNFGDKLLEKVDKFFKRGPEKLRDDERQQRIFWCEKMLNRANTEDVEGNYRRLWLANDLLPLYFEWRNLWYLGPKTSFKWLKTNDENVYKMFELLYSDPQNEEYLRTAINNIIS